MSELVTIDDPARMNLLGLVLRGVLERSLARRPSRLRGEVRISADGMEATLRFHDGGVELRREGQGRPRARISGSLASFIDAALGRGRIRAWLSGRLRVRGGPLTLARLLRVLRVSP